MRKGEMPAHIYKRTTAKTIMLERQNDRGEFFYEKRLMNYAVDCPHGDCLNHCDLPDCGISGSHPKRWLKNE